MRNNRVGLSSIWVAVAAALCALPAQAAIEEQPLPAPPPVEEPAAPVLTRPPELVEFVSAEYPEALLLTGVGGEVVLFIDIDADGHVEDVEVVSATEEAFRAPAVTAAKGFLFTPAEIDGRPAPIRIEYRYLFEPQLAEPDAIAGEPTVADQTLLPVTFRGKVLEAGNRKPIAGAVIQVAGRPVAESATDGSFAVRGVPPGGFHVRISSPFHAPFEVDEELAESEALEAKYYLVRKSNNPFETVVRTRAERREVSKVQLERAEVSKIPGTFGDPVRVIENLPGMARAPGGLGGALLVRGERPSSSAVYLDGVKIPLLYHFGGLTSVVNAEFLESIDFFPGGFGARFGDATAGIVSIKTRDLDCEMWRGAAKADFMDAGAFTCVPIQGWHAAVAGRRSYVDALLPLALDAADLAEDEGVISLTPYYWDYQAKAHARYGAHAFDIFAFGAHDRFELTQKGSTENINVEMGLTLTSHRLLLRHRLDLGRGASLVSSVAPGYVRQSMEAGSEDNGFDMSFTLPIWSVDWREDFTLPVSDWLTLRAGLDHRFGFADLGLTVPATTYVRPYPTPTFDYTQTQSNTQEIEQYNQGYWAEVELTPGFGIKLVPGLRIDRWDFLHTQGFSVQPRATVRWEALEATTLKAAYGVYEKLPEPNYLIEVMGNPWLPPERAQHFVAGFEHAFTDIIQLDVQGFYNRYTQRPTWANGVVFQDGRALPTQWEAAGTGRAYGLEILLRHLATANGSFYGWLAYTLSRSVWQDRERGATYIVENADGSLQERAYSERATGEYAAPYDQTHILTLVGQWKLPWAFEAGFRFRVVSGNPYSPDGQGRAYLDADQDAYGIDRADVPRNASRMPAFHQLDVRIDRTFTFDLWRFALYLELMNAYNAKNVEAFVWDYRFEERAAVTLLPIVPMLGVKGEF